MQELSQEQCRIMTNKQIGIYNTYIRGNKVYEERFNELYSEVGRMAIEDIRDEILYAGTNNITAEELKNLRNTNNEKFKQAMEHMFMDTYKNTDFNRNLIFMFENNWTIEQVCNRHTANPIHSFFRIISARNL